MKFLSFLFFSFCLQGLFAQDLPNTNVYLFQLERESDAAFNFSEPTYLTGFNPDGYNNQPCFISNNELMLSVRFPEGKQNDIFSLNLETGTKMQVTQTVESEYSPILMPDDVNFSAVRVEADENQTQRLWQFPISRQDNGKPVFKYLQNVGYHYWLNDKQVAMFIVGEPHVLYVANVRNQSWQELTPNIGRGFQGLPNGNLAYVHKANETTWFIKELDGKTLHSHIIAPTLAGSEDFVVLQDGTILMGRSSKIYKYHPVTDTEWMEIGDFRNYNITSITRMAVSKDGKLAIVGG